MAGAPYRLNQREGRRVENPPRPACRPNSAFRTATRKASPIVEAASGRRLAIGRSPIHCYALPRAEGSGLLLVRARRPQRTLLYTLPRAEALAPVGRRAHHVLWLPPRHGLSALLCPKHGRMGEALLRRDSGCPLPRILPQSGERDVRALGWPERMVRCRS